MGGYCWAPPLLVLNFRSTRKNSLPTIPRLNEGMAGEDRPSLLLRVVINTSRPGLYAHTDQETAMH